MRRSTPSFDYARAWARRQRNAGPAQQKPTSVKPQASGSGTANAPARSSNSNFLAELKINCTHPAALSITHILIPPAI